VLLSFGRDKAISGVTGGGVIVRDASVALRLTEAEHTAADVSGGTVARLLLYPMIYGKARLLWRIGLGRPFLRVCKALRLLLPITTAEEKRGRMSVTLHRMPNACATLALSSLLRLKHLNDHRRALTHFYTEAAHRHGWSVPRAIADPGGRNQEHGPATLLPLQKFPLFVVDADGMRALLKRENIYLEDGWTGCTICPRGTDLPSVNYTAGSDPVAEHSSERILALPTHPTMTLRGAKRLVRTLDVALRDRT
jgi:dTDP-4-amino-4,6-dideoxygalactose transaminase